MANKKTGFWCSMASSESEMRWNTRNIRRPRPKPNRKPALEVTIHEAMTDDYIASLAEAIGKVARRYAV
jgi:hypothetical protein